MIYPNVTLKDWLKKHPELKVITSHCMPCGAEIKSTRPFISKDYFGLENYPCPCGKGRSVCSTAVTRTKAARDSWREFI